MKVCDCCGSELSPFDEICEVELMARDRAEFSYDEVSRICPKCFDQITEILGLKELDND